MASAEEVGFELHKLHYMIRRTVESKLQKENVEDLPIINGRILKYLYLNQNRDIYQRDIEKEFAVSRSTVTGIIKNLEKRGFILRTSVEQDARLKKVVLTEKGIGNHEKIEHTIHCFDEQMVNGIPEEELSMFLKVVRKLQENIETSREEKGEESCSEHY